MSRAFHAVAELVKPAHGKAAPDNRLDFGAAHKRLQGHRSILSSLSEEDRKAVLTCNEQEVSGDLKCHIY